MNKLLLKRDTAKALKDEADVKQQQEKQAAELLAFVGDLPTDRAGRRRIYSERRYDKAQRQMCEAFVRAYRKLLAAEEG